MRKPKSPPKEIQEFHARNLPHIVPVGQIFFITDRLAGTIPKQLYFQWQKEKDEVIKNIKLQFTSHKEFTGQANTQIGELRKEQINRVQKLYFKKVDDYLDKALHGPTHLANSNIAEIVKQKIHQYDQLYYDLLAYSIMSNHMHLVIDTGIQLKNLPKGEKPNTHNYAQVGKFMGYIKGGSAYEANQKLNRNGKFWNRESYDHLIRDSTELFNSIRYTIKNAEEAGIVSHWRNHSFSYINPKWESIMN